MVYLNQKAVPEYNNNGIYFITFVIRSDVNVIGIFSTIYFIYFILYFISLLLVWLSAPGNYLV